MPTECRCCASGGFLLGALCDLERLALSLSGSSPPTRDTSQEGLAKAVGVLSGIGIDVRRLPVRNLHTAPVPIPPEALFDLLLEWRHWPASTFVPRLRQSGQKTLVSYRWLGLLPVVSMALASRSRGNHIVYYVSGGFGAGGYHSFLIDYVGDDSTLGSHLSIFTALPKHTLFPEGFHDQINRDIYRRLTFMASVGR